MAVSLGDPVLSLYERFSLYNSPYVAHGEGRAVDLYPADEQTGFETQPVVSPVTGTVLDVERVRAPPKPYAEADDYLALVDTGTHIARLLHVEPDVNPGDTIERGESLGRLVRAGFFAPWVPNHLHLEFRPTDANPYRASGSVPITLDVDIHPIEWDGSGTVVAAGETWALLDSPSHPRAGERFVGVGSDGGVLDGGCPHYDGGGLFGNGEVAKVAGTRVGTVNERNVSWDDIAIEVNGTRITGIAFFCSKGTFGVKLVGTDGQFPEGESVRIEVVPV